MNQFTKVEYSNIVYSLDPGNFTASIIGNNSAQGDIIIPRSIIYESNEYIVKSISRLAFVSSNINSIDFSSDSEVETIEGEAFSNSFLTSISFPSSIRELKEEWCFGITRVYKIDISPQNPYFKKYGEEIIIGKSSEEQEIFDVLVFCVRSVKTVKIPNFIRIIGSCSFNECEELLYVEIPEDSQLQIIEKEAFAYSSIESFTVPPSLIHIGEKAFFCCQELREIEIPENSNLQTIGMHGISCSSIESLTIPSSLVELKKGWCYDTEYLTEIYVSQNNKYYKLYDEILLIKKSSIEQENYDVLAFCNRSAMNVKIPSFIKRIEKYAFNYCKMMIKFEIPNDSELQIIENKAFSKSSIDSLYIPSNLIDLNEEWCDDMKCLFHISISPSNPRYMFLNEEIIVGKTSIEQEKYDILIFCVRDIETVKIPSFIKRIGPYAFNNCKLLQTVEFSSNSKLKRIDRFAFSCSSLERIILPSSVTLINELAFSNCLKLTSFEISFDSKLELIHESAFFRSQFKCFYIPRNLTQINKYAFDHCSSLQKVRIPADSELQIIHSDAFSSTKIGCFSFPPKVKYIGENIFVYCENLRIIEFDENSELEYIESRTFNKCKNVMIMIPYKLKDQFISVYERSVVKKINIE